MTLAQKGELKRISLQGKLNTQSRLVKEDPEVATKKSYADSANLIQRSFAIRREYSHMAYTSNDFKKKKNVTNPSLPTSIFVPGSVIEAEFHKSDDQAAEPLIRHGQKNIEKEETYEETQSRHHKNNVVYQNAPKTEELTKEYQFELSDSKCPTTQNISNRGGNINEQDALSEIIIKNKSGGPQALNKLNENELNNPSLQKVQFVN